jgi:hypothetical protein
MQPEIHLPLIFLPSTDHGLAHAIASRRTTACSANLSRCSFPSGAIAADWQSRKMEFANQLSA